MRRLVVLIGMILLGVGVATGPVSAHPITPPGHGGATVTGAGGPLGTAQGHFIGLPCADLVSEAVGTFPGTFCTIGFNG